jgi:membrane fusion protein, multidrug efflux system
VTEGIMTQPLLVAISIAGLTLACSTPQPPAPPEAPRANVRLARAEITNVPSQFEAGGVVRSRLVAPIASRVLAPVADVRVRPGARVRRGEPLVTLDVRELQAQADRATAALAATEQSVRAAESEKQGADAGLVLATASFDRINTLYAKRSATGQEFDESTAALQTARARVSSAAARVAEAQSALVAARSAASAAGITAAYATIAAPFDGVITERFVDPGAMASPGTALLTLEDPASCRLEVRLDEARATRIAVGQTAEIQIEGDMWTPAKVAEVSRIDPASHGFAVKVDMPPSAGCRSGAFGRARFSFASRAAVTSPSSSVVRRGQMTFVFAVDRDGLARLRPVSTGTADGGRVEILAGIKAGDEVVLDPPVTLGDGARVTAGGKR